MIEVPTKIEVYQDCEGSYHDTYEDALKRNKTLYLRKELDVLLAEEGFATERYEEIVKDFIIDSSDKLYGIFLAMNFELKRKND